MKLVRGCGAPSLVYASHPLISSAELRYHKSGRRIAVAIYDKADVSWPVREAAGRVGGRWARELERLPARESISKMIGYIDQFVAI